MKENLTYNFLQNIPIGEDLFEGKSQEKIACVVAENIENGEFQIIGIDGGWGTGKSNLVKIVENKLSKKGNDFKFFIYDVWGHQGDDQRKAILVELTDFIKDEKQVKDTKKWEDKLNKLIAKEREITTFNFPYLSVGFIFSLLSIIYIPTVNVFKDSITDFFGITNLFWKLVLVMFPIFIVFGIYIWNVIKNLCSKNGFGKSFKISAQETFQIYTNKQKEETKIETISEKEPSVRDFRTWMKDIDSDLTENKKKLVIIFDNFDRLPKKHIQSIWSSIHIFFSEEKYKNIKVIIPFDRAHIKNAFSELNGTNGAESKIDFANDYINKTFDIVFRIAPPIMCAWKDFFNKCWNEAFNNAINEEEYIRVEQIYEAHTKTITPRDIIAFVNEVISIKLLHKDIPEQYIGLFVANKDEILLDPLKAITEYKFLKGLEYLYKDSDDFQKYITALSYQIDSNNALEVIYKKQLIDALKNKDIETFNKISKTNIFNRIIFSTLSIFEDFENPILTIDALSADADITTAQRQALWDNIYLKNIIKARDNVEISNGEYLLFVKVSSKYREQCLSRYIDILLNHTNNFNPVKYAEFIDEIEKIIKDNSLKIDIHKLLQQQSVAPEKFIGLVAAKRDQYKKYKIAVDKAELDTYLSEQDVVSLDDSSYLNHLKSDFVFTKFAKKIKEDIGNNKNNTEVLSILFRVLKAISTSKPKLGVILTDAEIYTHFSSSNQEQDFYYDLIAMRLARGSEFHTSYASYFTTILSTDNENIIKNISERLEYYINYGEFLSNSVSFSNNLTKKIVKQITEIHYHMNIVNTKKLILSFDKICNQNELDPQIFISNLSRWDSPKFDDEFIESLSYFYIKEILKNKSRLATDTVSAITSYYNNLTQEKWKDIFDNLAGDLYSRTLIIKYSNWSSHSLEALKEVLLTICKTGILKNEEELSELLCSFEISERDLTNTFKNIRDEFILNRNINPSLFSFFGYWLFKYSSLEEKAGDVMRTIMIAPLLDNTACLEVILANQDKIKMLIEIATSNETTDFRDAIRDRLENDNVKDLAKHLGIRKRKSKEEETEENNAG